MSIEEKKKPEREIDRSIPGARERGGATGNIVALKKKTKLGKIVPRTRLREISNFVFPMICINPQFG